MTHHGVKYINTWLYTGMKQKWQGLDREYAHMHKLTYYIEEDAQKCGAHGDRPW
jgi:hypothetical protein